MSDVSQEKSVLTLNVSKTDPAGQFRSTTVLPQWAFMKFAASVRKKDETAQVAALLDMTRAIIKDEAEYERFEDYMNEGVDLEDLMEAINDWTEAVQSRPFPQSSSSAASSSETAPQLQVFSFEPVSDATAIPA